MNIEKLLNKRPQAFDIPYKIGNVLQDKETGQMSILYSVLYFHPDSPTQYMLKGVGFDGKQWQGSSALILASNLDEYMEIV